MQTTSSTAPLATLVRLRKISTGSSQRGLPFRQAEKSPHIPTGQLMLPYSATYRMKSVPSMQETWVRRMQSAQAPRCSVRNLDVANGTYFAMGTTGRASASSSRDHNCRNKAQRLSNKLLSFSAVLLLVRIVLDHGQKNAQLGPVPYQPPSSSP